MVESSKRLGVVVKGWPRLSETFIAQELVALEARGYSFDLWSLRHPTDTKRHPLHHMLKADVKYLPEYLYQEPMRVLRSLWHCLFKNSFWKTLIIWARDFLRDPTSNRGRRFGQALVLAREAPDSQQFFYSHFLHTPSSVTRYAAMIRGHDWGFAAHAKDIWTSPDWELEEKLADCAFGVTCTALGAKHLRGLAADPARIDLVYHGLDLGRFPPPPESRALKDGHGETVKLMSVGRLVEKKGYDILLNALALLPKNLNWQFEHIGGGDLKDTLQAQALELGLSDRIIWRGACDQSEVIAAMREADLFVLPCKIAEDGDRDGLPNVLMEAASQTLPIISSPVSSIPEFITHGEHGLLAEPNADALSKTLCEAIENPQTRAERAGAVYERLLAEFGMDAGIDLLAARLQKAVV